MISTASFVDVPRAEVGEPSTVPTFSAFAKPAGVVKRELDEQRNIVKYGKDIADILKTLGD